MRRILENKPSKILLTLFLLFLVLLIFVRIYNIDITARFTEDESSDLLRMYQYYKAHKITLVGPISNDHTKVFSSLTYYMLMPFAVAYGFTPVSPAYGAAFLGVITSLLLLSITYKLNKSLLPYIVILNIIWYPLLQTSRWAWNPNLVIFWIALGLLFSLKKNTISYFLSGIFFGLAVHNHYIAIIATGMFIFILCIKFLIQKNFKNSGSLIVGYILPFIPFALFDLRHPPGLFITHYLLKGNISNTKSITLIDAVPKILENFKLFGTYVAQNNILAVVLGFTLLTLLIRDISKDKNPLLYLIPVIIQLIAGVFLDSLQTRYILPGLIFLIVWLIYPRKSTGGTISKAALTILILGSMFSFYPQLNYTEVQPDVRTIEKADKIIINIIDSNHIKNVNIAVLGSKAPDTFAVNLRNALQVHDIYFLAPSQYSVSEQLLVLSTTDEKSLRNDQSFAMQQFRKTKLGGVYPVENTKWKIYWFRKI